MHRFALLQCFYGVKELRDALQGYADSPAMPPSGAQAQSHRLTVATKNLFKTLERSAAPVIPGNFLQVSPWAVYQGLCLKVYWQPADTLFCAISCTIRRLHLIAEIRTLMMRMQVLREKYPQFAELSRTGQYAQQDAEECWIQLMYSLRERVQVRN